MPKQIEPPAHLLSVVLDPEGDVVYLHADRAGLGHLREALDRLIRSLDKGEYPHDHLMSPDWGSWELTTSMLESERERGCRTVHHVKIYGWDDEWKRKHGLYRDAL